jgi:hypothetical protein
LDDTLKAVVLEIVLASAAQEKFLAIRVSKGLDLCVEHPFHVLQYQLASEGAIRRIGYGLPACGSSCCIVLGDLCIKPLAYVDQDVGCKSRTCFLVDLVSSCPSISYDFLCIATNPSAKWRLNLVPFHFVQLFCLFITCVQQTALIILLLYDSVLGYEFLFSLFGFVAL